MKELVVKTKMSEVKFNFPTELKELSSDYLKQVTDSVTVAPNYSLIGLVYHERLSNLLITCRNKKKTANIGVIPIFVKTGKGEASIVDSAKIGQKLLISNSQLQLAYHCAAPANKLTLDYFANVIDASVEREIYEKVSMDGDTREVLFVEFKIVPNCDIIALYDDANKVENPYVTVTPISE